MLKASPPPWGSDLSAPGRARSPGTTPLLVFMGVLLALALLVWVALDLWWSRREAIENHAREVRNTALVLADHTGRALQAINLAQVALADRLRLEGGTDGRSFRAWAARPQTLERLRGYAEELPQAASLAVADAAGNVLASAATGHGAGLNIADRAYFQTLRAGAESVISEPLKVRATGTWAIILARRLSAPNGSFLGVVLSSVRLDYFESFYGQLRLGSDSSIALVRKDGRLLARHPRLEEAIGHHAGDARQIHDISPRSDTEAEVVTSPLDGLARLVATQPLPDLPLAVSVGTRLDVVLAHWREHAVGNVIVVSLLLVLVAMLVRISIRQIAARAAVDRARLELAQEQARRERELADQHSQFREVVEGMPQGVWKFGEDGRLLIANQRSAELTQSPRDRLRIGMRFDEIALAKGVAGTALGTILARLAPLVAAGKAAFFVCDIPQGKAVAVSYRPLQSGGWVVTFEDVTTLRAAEERARHMALHDMLTGLPNRAQFQERLEAAVFGGDGAARLAVLCLDLDGFKGVNDTLGHAAGDVVLRTAARRLREQLRAGDLLARLGGDEFAVIMSLQPSEAPERAAAEVAGRLISALSTPVPVMGQQAQVGTSVGIAFMEGGRIAPEELLRRADLALYDAKRGGKRRFAVFRAAMEEGGAGDRRESALLPLR